MPELRHLPTEVLVEHPVLGRRRDPLFAAQHVRDLHQVIVDHVGQMVGRPAVGLHQNLHVDRVPVEGDRTAQQVVDRADSLARHFHPNGEGFAGRFIRRNLARVEAQTMTVVSRRHLAALLIAPHRLEPLRRAVALEGMSRFEQDLGVLRVDREAFALPVRAVRAADIRAFVPAQSEPVQRLEDDALGCDGAARAIRVLDAQDERAAEMLGVEIVDQRDVGRANVRIARRRRRDASPDRHRVIRRVRGVYRIRVRRIRRSAKVARRA